MTGEVAAPSLTTHAPRPPWRPVRAFDRPLRRPPRHAGEARPAASAHFGTGGPALLRPCRRTATAPPLVQGRGVPRLRRRCRPQRRCLFSFGCITRIVPIIAEHGERAGYVRNIRRDPRVRVRLHVGWRYRWVRAAPRSWPMTTRSRANETSSAGTPCARSTRSRSASSAPPAHRAGATRHAPGRGDTRERMVTLTLRKGRVYGPGRRSALGAWSRLEVTHVGVSVSGCRVAFKCPPDLERHRRLA
jgi:hypothetical protein